MRSFRLLVLQNAPPLLLSWCKPLLADHDTRLPICLGHRAGFPNPIPVNLHMSTWLCDLVPTCYSYRYILCCWSPRFRPTMVEFASPSFIDIPTEAGIPLQIRRSYFPRQRLDITTTTFLKGTDGTPIHGVAVELAWTVPSDHKDHVSRFP